MRRIIVFIYYGFIQQFVHSPTQLFNKIFSPNCGSGVVYIINSKMTETVPGFKELIQKQNEQAVEIVPSICLNQGFPSSSTGKESTCNVGDLGLIPGLGRPPGGGRGNPLQCSCLENSMDRGAHRLHSPWHCKELDMTE